MIKAVTTKQRCSFYSVTKLMWSKGASDDITRNCAKLPTGSTTRFSVFPIEGRPPRIPAWDTVVHWGLQGIGRGIFKTTRENKRKLSFKITYKIKFQNAREKVTLKIKAIKVIIGSTDAIKNPNNRAI